MAKTSLKVKQSRPAKFSTREYTRCERCGRPHSVFKKVQNYAVSASVNWLTRARFLELRRQAGKEVARDEYDRSYC